MDLVKKEEQSLKIFEGLYDSRRENILAFSGGKDSIVLYHLAKRTGLKFNKIYTNPTIDPPKHISFIRTNYPDVKIIQPVKSFYQLVEQKGLPTRHRRFCCQYLKEYVGKGAKVFEGLRMDESHKRGEKLKNLKEPEMCDTRMKGKTHAYPIMRWVEDEIWEYIHKYNLPYPSHYDLGFTRLGCIGCPLTNQKLRIKEYKIYPKYVYATIKAIDKNIEAGHNLSKVFSDPYEAFMWWISEVSLSTFLRKGFFKLDYKTEIEKMFPIK